MQKLKNYVKKIRIKYVLPAIPIILLGVYLYNHSVNVPFWDQWEIVPIIEHIKSGNIYFSDFWHQHNEHRLFFPRILMITSAFLTNWNLKAEILISFILAISSFVLLLKNVSILQKKKGFKVPFLLPLILGGVWFSLLQYENWLWGWQIQWYLNVFASMLVLFAISKIIIKPQYKYLSLAILGTIGAQYSLGNGVLIWPLLILALIYLKVERKMIGLTAFMALLSTALYYLNYKDPSGSTSKEILFHQPIGYIKYVSAYLGRPLSYQPQTAAVLGFLMASSFFTICAYLYLKKPERFKKLLPFIMMGLYAIASGMITGISRLGLGLGQSMSSRYTTMSSLLLVSFVIIATYNRDIIANYLKSTYKPFAYLVTSLLFLAIIMNMNSARLKADEKNQYLKDIKGCTSTETPYDICLLSTYPNKDSVTPRLKYLKSINWGGYNK